MKKAVSILLLLAISAQAGTLPSEVHMKRQYEAEETEIPSNPSNPPTLSQRVPPEIPHCERYFTFRGKRYECDSQIGLDAEKLRPIMVDVPDAIAEIDAYQKTQKQVRWAGYVGTLGVVSLIAGAASGKAVDPDTGALNVGAYLQIAGVLLAANALIYGLSIAKSNKSHIGHAVDLYNAAHPKDPIVPEFDTRIHF